MERTGHGSPAANRRNRMGGGERPEALLVRERPGLRARLLELGTYLCIVCRIELAQVLGPLGIDVDLMAWALRRRWTQDGDLGWPI